MCKPLDHLVDLSGGSQKTSLLGKCLPATETRPSAFVRLTSTGSCIGCVVLSKGCYANALQRRETAKNLRQCQLSRVDHARHEDRSLAFLVLVTGRSCQVSTFNLPCGQSLIQKTARRSDELAQTVACTPDRGDVCIMQGQIGGVNGFVVIIFVHYILSDKMVWV